MNIQIKISKKPVKYEKAINFLEKRFDDILSKKKPELIWLLEHCNVYTAGTSFDNKDILDKSISIKKTNRGGKVTFHGKGQIIFYFVINLNKRKKDIRWLINIIEQTIIDSLLEYKITSYRDKKNIGIWIKKNNNEKKIASIGIKIKKWIAFHGFSINIFTDKDKFKKINPCGITDKEIINLVDIKKLNIENFKKKLIKNFIYNLNN